MANEGEICDQVIISQIFFIIHIACHMNAGMNVYVYFSECYLRNQLNFSISFDSIPLDVKNFHHDIIQLSTAHMRKLFQADNAIWQSDTPFHLDFILSLM